MRPPRTLIAAFLLFEFVWWKTAAPSPMGYYLRFEEQGTHVAGGSHPLALAFSLAGILVFLWVINTGIEIQATRKAPLWRRFGAFVIDFYFAGSTVLWLVGLIAALLEAARTGSFQWYFARDYGVATDRWVGLPLGLLGMAVIFLYFTYPLTRARQTVGCYLLRIGTFNESAPEKLVALPLFDAGRRIVLEFRGLCAWWKLWRRKPNGQSWYDEKTNLIVLRY